MQIFNLKINHNRIYFYSLVLVAICLPLTKFGISVSMIILLANWLLENNFKQKWNALVKNKSVLIFILLFFVHLVWLINTRNFSYAFKDISNKAILLLFPVVVATSRRISSKELKYILLWFLSAVVASSLISTFILVGLIDIPIDDIRDISPFMSHIRLSLLVAFGAFALFYILYSKDYKLIITEKVLYILGIIWLGIFLFLLKSFTGIIIFFVVSLIILAKISFAIKELIPRLFLQVLLITGVLFVASYLSHSISKFYTKEIIHPENIENYSVNGNLYEHLFNEEQLENGNYVWIYVCDEELRKEWNNRSNLSYDSTDKKGQRLKSTLVRYMASKGLKKDSVGMTKLTQKDITNIENGMANYIFQDKYAIYPKIYQAIWEIDVYRKGNNPGGNSITQRAEYLKTAFHIIQDNFWFGVGTGDVKDSFKKQYIEDNSKLPLKKRLRTHNQYVTFLLTFGIFGCIIALFAIFYPIFNTKVYKNILALAFLLIVLLSFLNEDTLENQIGVTFFSYFYSLFLFGSNLLKTKGKEDV